MDYNEKWREFKAAHDIATLALQAMVRLWDETHIFAYTKIPRYLPDNFEDFVNDFAGMIPD